MPDHKSKTKSSKTQTKSPETKSPETEETLNQEEFDAFIAEIDAQPSTSLSESRQSRIYGEMVP